MSIAEFNNELTKLILNELKSSGRDADRIANVAERLTSVLGLTIAFAANGTPRGIDTLIESATAYAHSEAVRFTEIRNAMHKEKCK